VHLRSRFRSSNLAAGALAAAGGMTAAGTVVVPFSLPLLFLVLLH
jgi:hypothetical protein